MGLDIIIPVVILAVIMPLAFLWARSNLKDAGTAPIEPVDAPGGRLTSNALRDVPSPPWRVVYEIGDDKLGDIEHVLIGPGGIFALQTSMDVLPGSPDPDPDARAIAEPAIARGGLDDALARCAMTSDRLVRIHWGVPVEGDPNALDVLPGLTAVAGRSITDWVAGLPQDNLTDAQVDLAWQTVVTAIGRPDPLA